MKTSTISFFIITQVIMATILISVTSMGQQDQNNFCEDIGWYTSLALDRNDYPHISYYDYGNGDLKYCYYDGNTWTKDVVDSLGNVGRYSSVVLDNDNLPHISYYDVTNQDLKYAYFNGDEWQISTIDTTGKVGLFCSIDVDNSNKPHISYVDYDNYLLKYAHKNENGWDIEQIDEDVGLGEYFGDTTSIKIDTTNYPHISYTDRGQFNLKYAYYNGTNWMIQYVDQKGNVGQYSSLVLDGNDRPHISYACWSEFSLKYATLSNDNWNIQTIDSQGDVRKWTSIDLDQSAYPHISYYDYTKGSLQYIFFTGSTWQKETIDEAGSSGCFNSLKLASDNTILVSYYDWGNKSLCLASKQNQWSHITLEEDTFAIFIDQQQTYCSGYSYVINEGNPVAQSFIPTTTNLTIVELMLVKRYNPGGFIVSIRETLDGPDLTALSLTADDICEDMSWKTFDIPDISISPDETYYIVCSSESTNGYDSYYWYFGHNEPYPDGKGWINNNGQWNILTASGFPNLDFGFKTYGYINWKPELPTIKGPNSGNVGTKYTFEICSEDKNLDPLKYEIEWRENDQEFVGPFPSGEPVFVNHTWSEEGDYMIRVKAIDSYNAKSEWATFAVSMPKTYNNNQIRQLLIRFLDCFPFFEKILNQII
jgi:hypothetical protein